MATSDIDSPEPANESDEDAELKALLDDYDLLSKGCSLYPVFCTVDIPSAILDILITSVRDYSPPDSGAALCVLTPAPDSSIPTASAHLGGTRVPTKRFATPFKNKSVAELRKTFQEKFALEEGWANHCFAVLDQRTVEDGTVLVVTAESEEETEDELVLNHRCDGQITLCLLVGYEHANAGIDWHEAGSDVWDWVFTTKEFKRRRIGARVD